MESLWDDKDSIYWIPAGAGDQDPLKHVSFVYDNRNRLKTRIEQLLTGEHYAQVPKSRTQHFISNIDVIESSDHLVTVLCNMMVIECRLGKMIFRPGNVTYKLKNTGEDFKIVEKKILLVNNDQPLTSMGFLI